MRSNGYISLGNCRTATRNRISAVFERPNHRVNCLQTIQQRIAGAVHSTGSWRFRVLLLHVLQPNSISPHTPGSVFTICRVRLVFRPSRFLCEHRSVPGDCSSSRCCASIHRVRRRRFAPASASASRAAYRCPLALLPSKSFDSLQVSICSGTMRYMRSPLVVAF